MLTTLIILVIVASLLLWLVILVQNPKGGGISSQFGGSNVTNIIGAKQSVDVIEKATWVLGAAVVVLVVLSSFVTKPSDNTVGPGLDGGLTVPTEENAPMVAPEGEGTPPNGTMNLNDAEGENETPVE